ncbi:hypothetical protein CL621_01515 [archaeon]|nr:hypothetical protein [archaeon]
MKEWLNFINNSYINLAAPTIKIFKLDKTATEIDTLYNEAQSRIYLPPFEIKSLHLDNSWMQLLSSTYREQEENIVFVMNFETMVKTIRDQKNKHVTDIYVTYDGDTAVVPALKKSGDTLQLITDGSVVEMFNLNALTYNTTYKVASALQAQVGFEAEISGVNDDSSNIVNFATTTFQEAELNIYSLDDTFTNITDVVEAGDLVLTNKWRLYEVYNANPSGNFGWEWIQYSITCNLAPIERVNLPGNYIEQIRQHQLNLAQNLDMEGM